VVPVPEQPELPIPAPAASQPPPIALVRSEAIMAQVAFIEPPAKPIAMNEKNSPDSAAPGADAPASQENPAAKLVAQSADPLQSIKALSEEERLALFT
jgi:hypothetical protein